MRLTGDGRTRSKLNVLRTFCGLNGRSLSATSWRRSENQSLLESEPGRLTPLGQVGWKEVRRLRAEEARGVRRAQRREFSAVEAGTLADQPVVHVLAGHVRNPAADGDALREGAPDDDHGLRSRNGPPGRDG